MKIEDAHFDTAHFNPSMEEFNGARIVAYRKDSPSWNSGKSSIVVVHNGKRSTIATGAEDPRLAVHNETLVCTFNSTWVSNSCHIRMVVLDAGLNVASNARIEYGTSIEKNWVPFSVGGVLYAIYSHNPYQVIRIDATDKVALYHEQKGISWKYGVIRGGTPPKLVGDSFYTFFHSSIQTRRSGCCVGPYFTGCLQFSARPPFKVERYTRRPLFAPPEQDQHNLAIFPGGALFKDGEWSILCGRNNISCAMITIGHSELEGLLNSQ